MTAANHVVGGLAITGIAGSLMGINILEQEGYIVTTCLAALLPDIDHTKSPLGKVFYPVARGINRRFGHRTITHTLAALFLLTGIVGMWSVTYTGDKTYATIFFLAYLSHLLLDMITVMGVPLFYPLVKNACVIPGDPNLRIQSGDYRAEITAFIFFCLMFVFFKPLMATGFWTQYNRLFGSMKHLASEYQKSEDLLEVEYWGRIGSEKVQGKGFVIEAKEGKAVLVENGRFKVLDKNRMIIEKVLPSHTGRKFYFENQHFINVSEDSLNQLLINQQYIWEIEIHSDQSFKTWVHGVQQPMSTRFKGELFHNLYVEAVAQEIEEAATYQLVSNPQLPILRDKLDRAKQQQRVSQQVAAQQVATINQLQAAIQAEQDLVQQELLYQELQDLERVPAPKDYTSQIAELEIRIQELVKLDRLKNQQGRGAVEQANRKRQQVAETRFTGLVRVLQLGG